MIRVEVHERHTFVCTGCQTAFRGQTMFSLTTAKHCLATLCWDCSIDLRDKMREHIAAKPTDSVCTPQQTSERPPSQRSLGAAPGPLADRSSEESAPEMGAWTATSHLTPEEVAYARAAGQLRVEASGMGFVPTGWLARWRQRTSEPWSVCPHFPADDMMRRRCACWDWPDGRQRTNEAKCPHGHCSGCGLVICVAECTCDTPCPFCRTRTVARTETPEPIDLDAWVERFIRPHFERKCDGLTKEDCIQTIRQDLERLATRTGSGAP